MCIKQCIIFSYLSPCKILINGDNKPQVVIYMPVIMHSISQTVHIPQTVPVCDSYVYYQCL